MNKDMIWIVDDDRSIRWVLEKSFAKAGFNTDSFTNGDALLERLQSVQPDAIICDIRMPGTDGLDVLSAVHIKYPQVPVIIMTAHADLSSAVKSYKRGAFEYLPKPFDVNEAVAVAERAVKHGRQAKGEAPVTAAVESREIIGEASSMQEVFRAIGRLSHSNITVLIKGESGTGKELVAQALHKHSLRADKPYVPLNVAAIPKDLIESELFGHEKGAFTGATQARVGRFEQAHGGTLFLDEIGELPLPLQAKLLRMLQERRVRRVGARQENTVDVRVVAATSRAIEQMLARGDFRRDLYYRINVVRIDLPLLRDRGDDIGLLAEYFSNRAVQEMGRKVGGLSTDAYQVLKNYHWPGNVRELHNVVRRAIAMTQSTMAGVDDLPDDVVAAAGRAGADAGSVGFFAQRAEQIARFERQYLHDLLTRHLGDVSAAARDARLPRGTLYRLIKGHALDVATFRRET